MFAGNERSVNKVNLLIDCWTKRVMHGWIQGWSDINRPISSFSVIRLFEEPFSGQRLLQSLGLTDWAQSSRKFNRLLMFYTS